MDLTSAANASAPVNPDEGFRRRSRRRFSRARMCECVLAWAGVHVSGAVRFFRPARGRVYPLQGSFSRAIARLARRQRAKRLRNLDITRLCVEVGESRLRISGIGKSSPSSLKFSMARFKSDNSLSSNSLVSFGSSSSGSSSASDSGSEAVASLGSRSGSSRRTGTQVFFEGRGIESQPTMSGGLSFPSFPFFPFFPFPFPFPKTLWFR